MCWVAVGMILKNLALERCNDCLYPSPLFRGKDKSYLGAIVGGELRGQFCIITTEQKNAMLHNTITLATAFASCLCANGLTRIKLTVALLIISISFSCQHQASQANAAGAQYLKECLMSAQNVADASIAYEEEPSAANCKRLKVEIATYLQLAKGCTTPKEVIASWEAMQGELNCE